MTFAEATKMKKMTKSQNNFSVIALNTKSKDKDYWVDEYKFHKKGIQQKSADGLRRQTDEQVVSQREVQYTHIETLQLSLNLE